ncbi:hypothetical protein [Thiothrix lacustris]|uniref:hypothetical protein n=1 Tax=Thiothrix lacustris TaxID=525917 RepID=UPI0027E4B79B|nr:hypothetical protein [Thiothrix lacustris]WMP15854.1 hypothetical protein RCS87_10645 [Thiothrix lacustris]
MKDKTEGEKIFELFCSTNGIHFRKVPESAQPTPDYEVETEAGLVMFEIKQIDKSKGFNEEVKTREVGSHVRAKIGEARKQAQAAFAEGKPFVLLLFNNLDPLQLFGTEQHDFIAGMHGDMTIQINRDGSILDSFYGRNGKLRADKNTSFSAVGHIINRSKIIQVEIFTNPYAQLPLPTLSNCFCVSKVEIDAANGN